MELSSFMQTHEVTEEMMGELARKNQQLEQETIAQKHLLQLEKFKKDKVGGVILPVAPSPLPPSQCISLLSLLRSWQL